MVLQVVLNVIGDADFIDKLNNSSRTCVCKILLIFSMFHDKSKSGKTVKVDFNDQIGKNLDEWLKQSITSFSDKKRLIDT